MNQTIRYLLVLAPLACLGLSCQTQEQEPIGYGGHGHGGGGHGEEGGGHGGGEGGGHGHGHGSGNLSFTLFSETHELFGEIEPLVAGQPSQYTLHVSRLADNHPAKQGRLGIAFFAAGSAGSGQKPLAEAEAAVPARTGIFEFKADSPPTPGKYRLSVRYEEAPDHSSWDLDVEVKQERVAVPESEPGPGVVGFTKEQQWRVPFRVELPSRMELGSQRQTRAVVAVDPSATVVLSALAAGRVVWDGTGEALIPGRQIQAGELLGHLTASPPPDHASHIEAELAMTEAQISAVKADLDRIETLETSGLLTAEEESRETAALRTAEAELRRAEKDLARETLLVEKGLASQKDVLEARSLIEKARAERSRAEREIERIRAWSAGRYELAEDRVRNEADLARLAAMKESLSARLAEVQCGGNRVLEIRADKGGVLVSLPATSGSLVEVGSPLVQIHISDSVLVEVRALRADRAVLETARSVNLLRSGWGAGRTLESLGASAVTRVPLFDPDTGLYGLTYRLKDSASLVPGEVLDAVVTFGEAREELIVATSSVIEVSTLPYVFVLIGGESFERRRVELGPRVGDRVVIRSGLAADERVVAVGGFDIHVASLTSSLQSHQH
jgi:hypothetical protein